ncbi:ABC transporter permease [Nesterenkonia populi]|uniref:ABC transporter permease n=1 Tax=Nesterenkonia populi TaxID=1591087 RepID=UPI0014788121|nr:ABC transporter permease [Nesterenkonia populi]
MAWQITALSIDNSMVLPAFSSVVVAVTSMAVESGMREHLFDTLWRVVVGFGAGSGAGLLVGAAIGSFGLARRILNPYLNFLRSVSPIAWIVPATIWLGIGEPPIQFVVIYATVFPVAINTISGIASVHNDKIRMARTFGMSSLGIFRSVLIPSAVPYTLVGARLALGLAFMAVVGAEMIIGRSGLGFLIFDARTTFSTDLMFACILILGVIGYLGDLLFVMLRKTIFGRYYAGSADL